MEPSFGEILEDYKKFLAEYTQTRSEILKNYYEDVANRMAFDFEQSEFFKN